MSHRRRLYFSSKKRTGKFEGCHYISSKTSGYQFNIYLIGEWEEALSRYRHNNPKDAAADYAIRVAQEICETRILTEASVVEARINTTLGRPRELTDKTVRLIWAHARVSVDPLQEKAVVEQLQREHEAVLQEKEDHRRLQRARDLRNAMMTDPSIALAQWFMNHPGSIDEQTVQRMGWLIEEMTAYAPDTMWIKSARIIHDFVRELPLDRRLHLIETLAGIFDRYGYPEHAKQLRFDVLKMDDNGPSNESNPG